MANRNFLTKAFERIDRVDKKTLVQWVVELTKERDFLNHLLNSVREGILIVDKNTCISFMNKAAELYLNIQFKNSKMPIQAVIEDQAFRQFITETIREEKDVYGELFEIFLPRHQPFQISIFKWPPEKDSSRKDQVYLILLIPETKREERAKEDYQFEKLSSVLSLATGIAHEIGNPLNSITVHLHLLSKDIEALPKPERHRLKKSVDVVREETSRLDMIVRNFLKATRRKPIRFQIGHIHEIIQDLLVLLEPELKAKRIRLQTQFDTALPSFLIDPERISQVLMNLVKNALQAMPTGGKLSISTALNKNICMITISDTGVGIQRRELSKIFDPYYTTKEEGSGLGLVIAYQIIREHSGRIEVMSDLGKGTSFQILLPIRKQKLQLPSPHLKHRVNSHDSFI